MAKEQDLSDQRVPPRLRGPPCIILACNRPPEIVQATWSTITWPPSTSEMRVAPHGRPERSEPGLLEGLTHTTQVLASAGTRTVLAHALCNVCVLSSFKSNISKAKQAVTLATG